MSEKRKDSKGRILKTGESQRKDGLYQYRYKDINGARRTIYENDLKRLREREKEIEASLAQGISTHAGSITLRDYMAQYFETKQGWRPTTRATMEVTIGMIKDSPLRKTPINKITRMDMKRLYIDLQKQGYAYRTIEQLHLLIKAALNVACEDGAIQRNPCAFKISGVITKDRKKVSALTRQQTAELLQYLQKQERNKSWQHIAVILLDTGLRVGEFTALTTHDIDFERRTIQVNKQLQVVNRKPIIADTKTSSGCREIPMTSAVEESIHALLNMRRDIPGNVSIDGYSDFILTDQNGAPRTASALDAQLRRIVEQYNITATHKIERCTPHVLRHTFCTRCVAAGMDIKSVQYLMGHANATITLNVYADAVREQVSENINLLSIPA